MKAKLDVGSILPFILKRMASTRRRIGAGNAGLAIYFSIALVFLRGTLL
jgi:hypothetical protein